MEGSLVRPGTGTPGRSGRRRCAGQSTPGLIGALALIAVITLLLQVQSGLLETTGIISVKPAARTTSRKGKPPEILPAIPPVPVADEVQLADAFAPRTAVDPATRVRRELWQAVAHMDGRAAAAMLSELDVETVATVLGHLRERDLARVLEHADPADAALWVTELLSQNPVAPALSAAEAAVEETAATVPPSPTAEEPADAAAAAEVEEPPEAEAAGGEAEEAAAASEPPQHPSLPNIA